jgi:Txe/YoeB family toxin of Txe-Axe toxin-antitoxin module
VSWTVLFTRQAQKDARKLASASPALKQKAQDLLALLAVAPYQQPPPYEGTPEKDFRASTSNSRQEPRVFEPLIHADTGVVRFHKEGLRIPLDTLSDVQSPSKP